MPQPSKPRTARALANDAAILDAGIQELLAVGIDRVSLRGVSARAGLTHGATYARYEDADELLVDLWNSRLQDVATRLFALCEKAVREPGEASIAELFGYIRNASSEDVASLHIVLSARRIPILLEEVDPFINRFVRSENCRSAVVSATFTRTLCVYGIAVAEILYHYHTSSSGKYHPELESWLIESLGTDAMSVPTLDSHDPDGSFLKNTGSDLRSNLAFATYQVIGKSGYTHATVSRIARRAKCSPGAIYNLFDSKEELVADSYLAAMQTRQIRMTEFIHFLDEGVLSQTLFDIAHETNALWRDYILEFSLSTAFNAYLFQAMARQVQEVNAVIPFLAGTSEEQRRLLSSLVLVLRLMNIGISFVAAVSGEMQCTNFAQFTEPFRVAILNSAGPVWPKLCAQLLSLDDETSELPLLRGVTD